VIKRNKEAAILSLLLRRFQSRRFPEVAIFFSLWTITLALMLSNLLLR
jgi:hypothetical protein